MFVDIVRCSVKTGALKNFANFICFTCLSCWSLFLIKFQALSSATQVTPTQVFCCETCEIFKNVYFEEQLWATASFLKTLANFREKHLRQSLKACTFIKTKLSSTGIFLWNLQNFEEHSALASASKICYRTTRFWKKWPIHFMKTKYTMLNFTNVTQ